MHGWVNAEVLPPLLLVTHGVEGPVVGCAEGYGPLVAYLAPDGPRLGKTEMVGMAWRTPADEAGPGGHVAEMLLVPESPQRAD